MKTTADDYPGVRRVLVAVALAALGLVLPAAPAFAHAQLLSTEPVGGTAAADAPRQVVLRFSEPVQVSQVGVRVFDADAERVTTETARHPKGKAQEVALPLPDLANGGYVVTWRVTSADSHPVHGAFTFRVGPVPASGSNDQALARQLLAADGGDTTVGATYSALRFLAYGSLVLLVGSLAFVALVWPAGRRMPRARRLVLAAGAVLAITTALGIPTQALYVNGLAFSDLSTVGSHLFDSRFGQVWGVRLLLLGLLAVVLVAFRRWDARSPQDAAPPRPLLAGGGLTAAGLLLTPALAGHAATRDLVPLAVASDLVHLASVSLWLGGLVCLVACVLPRRLADELSTVVPRFSRLATVAVAAVLVTGVFQAWREVGSKDALTSTTYGRLLMVKVMLFGLLVGLGGLSRRWIHARYRVPALRLSPGPGAAALDQDAETVSRLRRTVGAETVVAVVVLAVTALLVAAEPARSALARPFSTELTTDDLLIDVTVDPAKAGPADFHFYTLTPEGAVSDVAEFTARLRLAEADVGPLPLNVEKVAPGHYAAYRSELPLRGSWELEVVARLTEIDQVRATATIPVR
ncbi:MAG: CopD family protein [Actinomycetota bacterium]|nr:CopD family protein [Actinomycetota bacterium]